MSRDSNPIASPLDDAVLEQLVYSERMAELGKLSVGVIHELNTPLSVVASLTQLILREEGLPDGVPEMVERIAAEVHRLSRMSKGILSLARMEGDEGRQADLNLVIGEVLQILSYEIQKRAVRVIADYDHELPILTLDPDRLKQVFLNLVMNALQSMDSGGLLKIRTSFSSTGFCRAEITDNGAGISPSVIDRIFEPFFTTKKSGEGTGLGLFVTSRILHAFGGAISVESTPGKGTTFTVQVPSS